MSPAAVTFEVLRFEAVPAAAGVAVLELDGRFAAAAAAPERPWLLVEGPAARIELPAVAVVREPWSATFAVPLEALGDPATTFALVPGRGPLIALPSPSLAGAEDDRFVRLARTVNDLRHRLSEAAAVAEAAEARRAETTGQRDRAVAELNHARLRITELERRSAELEEAARTGDERAAQAERAAAEAARTGDERAAQAERAAAEAERAAAEAQAEIAALTGRAEAAERAAAEASEARAAADQNAAEAGSVLGALRTELEQLEEERDRLVREADAARAQAARADAAPADAARTDAARADADADADAGDDTDETATLDTRRLDAGRAAGGAVRFDRDATAAGDPTQTLELPAEDVDRTPPEDEPEHSVRVLGPRTARRPVPARRSVEGARTPGAEDPAVIGARFIEPSSTPPHGLTPARMLVGGAVLLLFLALLLIFLSV